MTTYTPAIYKELGTKVSIDLGATTKLGVIEETVQRLDSKLDQVQDQQLNNTQALTLRFAQLDDSTAAIAATIAQETERASQRHVDLTSTLQKLDYLPQLTELKQLITTQVGQRPRTDTVSPAPLSQRSLPTIKLLHELQALLLHHQPSAKDLVKAGHLKDRAFNALAGKPELQHKLDAACRRLQQDNLAERSARYWELHRLIEEVATCHADATAIPAPVTSVAISA